MSVSTNSESQSDAQALSIKVALQRLLISILAMLQTRLSIASIELSEARDRVLRLVLWGLLGLLFVGLSFIAFSVLVLMWYWETYRVSALIGLIFLYLSLGCLCAWRVRSSLLKAPSFLGITLDELKKDCEVLRS